MRLDDRLQAVADFVPSGCRVADIGTDHAYLAIELYKNDSSRFVIAADKNAGPVILRRRQKLFSEYIKGLIEGQERIAAGLRQASSSSAADGLSRVTEQIIKLKELLTV